MRDIMEPSEFLRYWQRELLDRLDTERAKAACCFTLVIPDRQRHLCAEGRTLNALRELARIRGARWITN